MSETSCLAKPEPKASEKCLDETTVTLFLDQRLTADRGIAVEDHIDGCEACRRLLSELARAIRR